MDMVIHEVLLLIFHNKTSKESDEFFLRGRYVNGYRINPIFFLSVILYWNQVFENPY